MNWRHAAAELALIVLGVTIALAASSWYEGRQRHQDEVALLSEIRTTLAEDLAGVSAGYETIRRVSRDLGTLEELLDGDTFDWGDADHRRLLSSLERFTQVVFRTGPFETLKARGLDLVSNQPLRVALTSLYDDELPTLQLSAEIDQRLSRDRVLPYLLDNFELTAEGWTPIPGRLQTARSVGITLARYRSGTLVTYFLPSFERAIALINSALAEIDSELDDIGIS
jgi:hypothetical protein